MSAFDPICRACGRVLDRRDHESLAHYRARTRCEGDGCAGRGTLARFPKAQAMPAAALPRTCLRCGGLYRWVGDGVACYLCPWHQVVLERLCELATREGHEVRDSWQWLRLGGRPKPRAG